MVDLGAQWQKGKDYITLAVKFDHEKNYDKAFLNYENALRHFIFVIKHEKDETMRRSYQSVIEQYIRRAEELKAAKGGAASGGGGGATAKPGDPAAEETADAETKRLQDMLSGAVVSEKPNIKWTSVAGLEIAKANLQEAVILPAKYPQLFTGGREPWRGILLYGPPGTGKSYLAKAVATEADASFFSLSSSDLVSKWQGESERLVKALFTLARAKSPSIIFIDEVDSLCSARGEGQSESSHRILTEFLVQMDGVGKETKGVLVLGATNVPWDIDSAMRRRFEKRVYIPLPDEEARRTMFRIHLGKTPHNVDEDGFTQLGIMSEGLSGSDIKGVVKSALMEPVRRCRTSRFWARGADGKWRPVSETAPGASPMSLMDIPGAELGVPDVSMEDFRSVMARAKGSVGVDELSRYDEWTADFGEEGA